MAWGPTKNTSNIPSTCKISTQFSLLLVLFADPTSTWRSAIGALFKKKIFNSDRKKKKNLRNLL